LRSRKFKILNSRFKIRFVRGRRVSVSFGSGRNLRRDGTKRTCGTRDAGLRPGAAAGCCALVGANSEFKIQNSELPNRSAACEGRASGLADASCGPSRGEAAARCGSFSEPQIQDSKLKEIAGYVWASIPVRVAAYGGQSSITNCGPPPPQAAARCCSLPEPQIQHSKFKIQN